jgi:putative transposase
MQILNQAQAGTEQLIVWRGKPKAIRYNDGPEYISHALREWAQAMDIELMYKPGKPTQKNAYIERFNRTARRLLEAI